MHRGDRRPCSPQTALLSSKPTTDDGSTASIQDLTADAPEEDKDTDGPIS